MESKNDTNAEKSVKKIWAKPEVILLGTNDVTSGTNRGHYEKNASSPFGIAGFILHTPGGANFTRLISKNFYMS